MADLPKKRLDDLFKEGTERHDFDYNPEAWNRMEVLLDLDDRRRRMWWWVLGILLLISLLFLAGSIRSVISPISMDASSASLPSINPSTETESFSSPDNRAGSTFAPDSSLSAVASPDLLLDNPIQPKGPANSAERQQIQNDPFRSISSSIQAENSDIVEEESLVASTIQESKKTEEKVGINKGQETITNAEAPLDPIQSLELSRFRLPIVQASTPALPVFSASKSYIEPTTQISRLMIGLQAGIEWGSPKFTQFTDPSWNVGVQLEYQYAWKYAISLGLTYSNKDYLAAGSQYDAPEGFWHGKDEPDWVNGRCNILELPVQLGYYFSGYRKSGLFASAGLTSYFMLHESYNYSYDQTQTGQKENWEGKRLNQHWFGIGHFSVGYQMALSDKASLQFAPYLQVPFTGVGHGQVWLYTVGTHVRISFQGL